MVLWESDCFYSLCNTSQNWPNPLDARTPLKNIQPGGWVSLFTASFCNIMMFWKRSGFGGWVGLLKPFSPECCFFFFFYQPRSVSPHDRSPGVLRATNPAEEGTAQATCLYHRRRTIHRVPGREPLPQTRPGGYPPTLAVGPTSSDVSGYRSDIHQWGL